MKLGTKPPTTNTPQTITMQPKSATSGFDLPRQISTPPDDIAQYTILLAGEKKIGKTDFCAQWPDHFIIEGEPGNAKHVVGRYTDVADWLSVKRIVSLLEKEHDYCKTLIIDDITSIYSLCFNWKLKELGIDYPDQSLGEGKKDYGRGWNIVKNEFIPIIQRIQNLPYGKIYTVHTAIKEVETRSGGTYNRIETSMGKQCNEVMDTYINLWGVMLYDKKDRVIQIVGDEEVKAGHNLKTHFRHPTTNEPMRQIPMGNSASEAYENFINAFHNRLDYVAPERKQRGKT